MENLFCGHCSSWYAMTKLFAPIFLTTEQVALPHLTVSRIQKEKRKYKKTELISACFLRDFVVVFIWKGQAKWKDILSSKMSLTLERTHSSFQEPTLQSWLWDINVPRISLGSEMVLGISQRFSSLWQWPSASHFKVLNSHPSGKLIIRVSQLLMDFKCPQNPLCI